MKLSLSMTRDKMICTTVRDTFRRKLMRQILYPSCMAVLLCGFMFWMLSWTLRFGEPAQFRTIDIFKPVRRVSDKFLSIAIDTANIRNGHMNISLKSETLQVMAANLKPAYLRVGGTASDCLLFKVDPDQDEYQDEYDNFCDEGVCSYEERKCSKRPTEFTMSGLEWLQINEFAKSTGLKLIFDLNVLLRDGGKWNSTNAKELLEFSQRFGYPVVWQLGNEPNSFQHVFQTSVPSHQLGEDFAVLRKLLDSFSIYNTSLLIGPDVTRPKHFQQESIEYLGNFLASVDDRTMDAITWHQYYLNGRTATVEDFIDPKTFNILEQQIIAMKKVTDEYFPHTPVWLTETSSAYGGGVPGLSDAFVAGFLWLDKLGVAARMGIDVVIRQSLFGGHYGLLDSHSFEPYPDWWLSILFKMLVGDIVLEMDPDLPHGPVRFYYHCSSPTVMKRNNGVVTIFGMNLMDNHMEVNLPDISALLPSPTGVKAAYILTGELGLPSKSVLLNGKALKLGPDCSLPEFIPVYSNIYTPLILPSHSIGFWVLFDISVPACKYSELV